MKPYLTENPPVAFLIEWGGLILVLALVLSPFLIIRLKRFKPTRWWHILGAYAASSLLFFGIEWVLTLVHNEIAIHFTNYGWLTRAFIDISVKAIPILAVLYPILVFYSTKLLYLNFNKNNVLLSLIISLLLLLVLIVALAFAVAIGVSSGFMNHF